MTTDFIYSVEDLFTIFLQRGGASYFNIPPYQRGYKWRGEAVLKLLEDISSLNLQRDSKKFYCLQNITLVKDSISGFFNVVDGQQRLTTLVVILACLDESDKVREKVKYSSREETTQAFISNFILDSGNSREIIAYDWNSFAHHHSDLDYQDIFYLHSAYRTVHEWYKGKTNEEQSILKDTILHRVKIIVNLIQDSDEQKLFGNLNGARVQLDGADLVRALIITNVARMEFPDAELTVQQAVQLNEKRVKIGMELDAMTRWWKDPAHLLLFSPAIKAVTRVEDIPFDEDKYPINGLYKLHALIQEKKEITLGLFEKNVVENWKGIRYLQRILSTWTEDREAYHLVGYLLRYSKDPAADVFKDVFQKWEKSTRTQFIKEIKGMIQTDILDDFKEGPHPLFIKDATDFEVQCYKEDWYNDSPKDVIKLMVLLDVINIVKSPGKRFLAPEYFVPSSEDKEHIFPQSPLGGKLDAKDKKAKMEIVNAYIDLVNKTLKNDKPIPPLTDEAALDDENKVDDLKQLVDAIKKVIPINCLGNLCLLAVNINRGYGNDFYTEKRIAIISADREGSFIRPHVLDAFDKAWTEKNQVIHHMSQWGRQEILDRRKYIEITITDFFSDAKH